MLFNDALGKPVAYALALLLIVADRPAFLPLLIYLPSLLQRRGIDGMFRGKDQDAARDQRLLQDGEERGDVW